MITLINPPQPNSLDDRLDPPLGLMYIAAVLREQGYDVKIVDLCMFDRRVWKEAIGYADVYGITIFSASFHLAKKIANIAKRNNPDSKIVVGGPHPTSLPKETSKFFDYVVKGEGEFSIFPLDGRIREASLIEDLNILPAPARDLVNLHQYTRRVLGEKATSITTSRGCPYRCAFCCKDIFGHKVRCFSIDRVIEELKNIISDYGIRGFIFYDDTLALDRERFYSLCERLRKLNIIFRCNGDSRNNTLEDFKVLYDAGCREIAFGIESGSQEILDRIHKGTTVEKNRVAIQNAKKVGLVVKVYLMIGNPGESIKTVEETKSFMKEADPDQYTLFNFVPLPGCDIWKDPAKYGIKIVNKNFRDYYNIAGNNEGGLVVETEELTCSQVERLRQDLLESLGRPRGRLQDYYRRLGELNAKGVGI